MVGHRAVVVPVRGVCGDIAYPGFGFSDAVGGAMGCHADDCGMDGAGRSSGWSSPVLGDQTLGRNTYLAIGFTTRRPRRTLLHVRVWGPHAAVRPTLNTSAETARLFKVLSVEVLNLRCVSAHTFVEMQSTLNKWDSILKWTLNGASRP